MARKYMSPGDFSHRSLGVSKHVHTGWRDFGAECDWSTLADPNNQVDSVTFGSTGIVITYTDVLTGEIHVHDMACAAIPLKNKNGEIVTWADSFLLRTQIEFISATGDFGDDDDDMHTPVFGLGIGKNAGREDVDEFDGTSGANKYMGRGLMIYQKDGSDLPKFKAYVARSHQAAGSAQGDSANMGIHTKHLLSNFYVGPAVGSAQSLAYSQQMTGWAGRNSSGSYAKNTNVTTHSYTQTHNDAVPDTDTPVYLFAFFGSTETTDGSNDPAVVTCKMRYMCTSNPGKGGDGIT